MIDCHICQVREAVALRVLIRGGRVVPLCRRCRGMHGIYRKRAKLTTQSTTNEVPKCPTNPTRQMTFL